MSILFGHPTGNPNSHHAALAHLEAGRLEALCLPWMPTPVELGWLRRIPGLRAHVPRLERRCFPPLLAAPRIEGRLGEWSRLARRIAFGERFGSAALADAANAWLMHVMVRACRRRTVTAVHAYEDCALGPFAEARQLGKACLYDLPIGYYRAWEQIRPQLFSEYRDWLPDGPAAGLGSDRLAQKTRELELADLILVPSEFVRQTVLDHIDRPVMVAPYGVEAADWPAPPRDHAGRLVFLFAGQVSIRKGAPLLLQAWARAGLKDASLLLAGPWQLSAAKKRALPPRCTWLGPLATSALRTQYASADVFVFPTCFEGRALVVLEAMASGLPVISTLESGASDLIDDATGRLVPSGRLDALIEAMRWFADHRDRIPAMGRAARLRAEACTWDQYRRQVSAAAVPLLGAPTLRGAVAAW